MAKAKRKPARRRDERSDFVAALMKGGLRQVSSLLADIVWACNADLELTAIKRLELKRKTLMSLREIMAGDKLANQVTELIDSNDRTMALWQEQQGDGITRRHHAATWSDGDSARTDQSCEPLPRLRN